MKKFFVGLGPLFLFWMISLDGGLVWADRPPQEFRQQTQEHRARVLQFSLMVFAKFPQMFGSLDTDLIKAYVGLHDLPKVMSLDQLRRVGYTHPLDINTRLAKFDGIPRSQMNDEQLAEFDPILLDLNSLEKRIKESFFQLQSVTPEEQFALGRLVESIADIVDTKLNRIKEVGIVKPSAFDAVKWIILYKHDIPAAMAAAWLEKQIYVDRGMPLPPRSTWGALMCEEAAWTH